MTASPGADVVREVATRVERCRQELAAASHGAGSAARLAAAQERARRGAEILAAALAATESLERGLAPQQQPPPSASACTQAEDVAALRAATAALQRASAESGGLDDGALCEALAQHAAPAAAARGALLRGVAGALEATSLLAEVPELLGAHPASAGAAASAAAVSTAAAHALAAARAGLSAALARADDIAWAVAARDDAEDAHADSLRAVGAAAAAAEEQCEARERFADALLQQAALLSDGEGGFSEEASDEGLARLAAEADTLLGISAATDEASAALDSCAHRQTATFAAFEARARPGLGCMIGVMQAELREAAAQAVAAETSSHEAVAEAAALAEAAAAASSAAAAAAAARQVCEQLRLACQRRTAALLQLEDSESERRKGQLRGTWSAAAEGAHEARMAALRAEAAGERAAELRLIAALPGEEAPELAALRLAVVETDEALSLAPDKAVF